MNINNILNNMDTGGNNSSSGILDNISITTAEDILGETFNELKQQ